MTFTLSGDVLKEEEFYLICTDHRISMLELWINGEAVTDGPIGRDYLFNKRNIRHRNLVYNLSHEKKLRIVAKIRSNQSTFFEVKAEDQFHSDAFFETGLLGSAHGIIILATFSHLFMLLKFRESIYVPTRFLRQYLWLYLSI